MKSKTKKSCDRKSTASRGQGSAQHHRLTSGARTPSPPHHETTPLPSTTAVVVLSPDASPLPAGGQSLTVRIASKTLLGRKSCEPAGNGHPLREGSEVTGSEPVGTSVVLAGGSDTSAPEVVEGPEMKQRMMMSVDGGSGCSSSSSSSNHQTPPTKRMKMMMTRETQPSSSSSLSSAERCNAGVLTDPDCLGPCDPGSSVILEGIVWNESRNGLLVVNVTWRGKTYVGTLMDSTNHNWASPSFKEDSLSTTDNNNSSSRDEDGGGGSGVAMAPEGRRLRRCRTMQPGNGVTGVMTTASASAASSSSASTTSSTASSKTSTTRTTKCRVQVGDNAAVQTDPVNLQQTLNGVGNGGDAGILCPELHCQRRFKHESALRNHRFRAHKATTDSIATSTFATSSAATSAAATSSARSIVDDCVGSALTTTAAAQSKGPSLLLHAKQRCFDGDEDVSSGGGGCRGIKKTEDDGARLCITEEKDGDDGVEAEEEEEDCSSSTLIRSASSGMMENNKLDCFVLSSSSSRCLQSTMPIVCSGSVQMLSCGAKLASSTAAAAAEMENGTGETTALDSSDCAVSDGAVPMRDGAECTTVVCADRQKMRNGAKKHCKGRLDRGGVQKNSEAVVSSACVASQMLLGQSSTTVVGEEASAAGGSAAGTSAAGASATGASVAGASATGALLSLHSSEDKHCAKRLKTNGGMPFSMLSVSLNRIPMENNESSLTRKMVPATETRSDDRLQDAERSGSSSCSAAVDSVRGLGLDVAKLCIVSGFGSSPGREPSAGKTPSQSLFAMRGEVMGRYPPEKTQVDNSKCHLVKSGNMHTEEIGKPQLESSCVVSTPGKGQNGSDSQTSSDRALTPSKLVFQSSKTCHDKLLAPGVVRDGNQKQTGLHSSSSFMFGAADSSKSILNHVGKESTLVSHLSYVDKTKPELSTSSAKGIPTSAFSLRNSTGESIGSQAAKQKCPSFSNPDQAIIPDRGCTAISSSAVSSGGSGGPTVYAKDIMMMCDLNSFTSNNVQKDFSDLKGALPSRSTTIPFAVPMGSRSIPNGNLAWTTSPFVSSMSSLQHTTTRSKASSSDPPSPLTSRGSTYVTALASSMSSSALTADCSFVPFCRAIQGAPATTTSLPKQTNKFCAPPPSSPPLASCPLEANTASEVFVRRDDGSWTSASGGKSAQQQQQQQQQQQHAMISNSSCPDRNLLVCGDISLPLPLQSPLSSSSGLSSSSATDLHHVGVGGVIPYQQKKEKMLSALHSSAMKPPQSSSSTSSSSSSSRSLLTGHSVQAACPK